MPTRYTVCDKEKGTAYICDHVDRKYTLSACPFPNGYGVRNSSRVAVAEMA